MSLLRMDRRFWVTLNISIGVFMSTLDASIVNISLPTIIETLNTSVKAGSWVVIAYLVSVQVKRMRKAHEAQVNMAQANEAEDNK